MKIVQVAISGWAICHGSSVLRWNEVRDLIENELLSLEPGFKFDLAWIQVGTNDAAQGLVKGYQRDVDFPATDVEFWVEIEHNAARLGLSFARNVALGGFGSSNVKCNRQLRLAGPQPLKDPMSTYEVHQLVSRAHFHSMVASYEENVAIEAGRPPAILHAPLSFWPSSALQTMDKLGHVGARFYGDLAADFINAIQHGLRKVDPNFRARYVLCPGLPPALTGDYRMIVPGLAPGVQHRHPGDEEDCRGIFHPIPRSMRGGELEIIWHDHEYLERRLYGETAAVPMYL